MFPDVKSEDGEHNFVQSTLHQRVVLVRSTDQFELVALFIDTDPNPTGSKEGAGGSTGFKGGLHFVHASKGLVDEFLQLSRRLGGLGLVRRSHFLPEEGVVVVTTSIVTNCRTGFNGRLHQVEDRNLILTFHRLVDIGDVGSVMFVVMDFHGRSVNVGFKGLKGVREVRNGVRVGSGRRSGNRSTGGQSGSSLLKESTTRRRSICLHRHGGPGSGLSGGKKGDSKGELHGSNELSWFESTL
mmetsp:Transcript_15461/g.31417  ORF Transcript_15461/g.31417 Transcript_15461/m.31417 type:complete len:241 (+) Transcript_15461:177-899(+)